MAVASDIESRGLIFELQWKKKPGVTNKEEDIASLGIWDTTDPSLDWCTFKSYLSQNLGTPEDISVAYVDSEGDELPIESECEFQEALKFARERSRKGRKIILKVDKQESVVAPAVVKPDKKRTLKHKHARGIKLTERFNHSFDFMQPKMLGLQDKSSAMDDHVKSIKQVLTKDLEDLHKYNKILMEKLERMSKLEDERRKLEDEHRKKHKPERDDLPPPWFKKYMQKMKHEIVTEVTANTRQLINNMMSNTSRSGDKNGGGYVATKVKKRSSDEESSDAALGSDHRDHKLLRKIEKLHKREKKLEKKLDSKLEKLENKTKRMMEKKSQSKTVLDRDRIAEKKITKKRSGDGPVGTYLMDAILLNDGPKAETHIKLGKRFTKIWEIMNNGTLPWTDKTELRLAWGTLGLEPEESSVKCPILEPGEKGQIAVNFRAPDFPGTFESYWHFYHMGERFGHWIGCAVVVEEPNKCEKSDFRSCDQKASGPCMRPNTNDTLNGETLEILDNIASSFEEYTPGVRINGVANGHCVCVNEVEGNVKPDVVGDLSSKAKPEEVSNLHCNHANNNNINESPDQQKSNLISDIKVMCDRGPEYDSESDDDNLSIISEIDLSSESDDENFVVIPMPPCFLHDQPLKNESEHVAVKDNCGTVVITVGTSKEGKGEGYLLSSTMSHEDQKVPACSLTEKSQNVVSTGAAESLHPKMYPFGSFEVNFENKDESTFTSTCPPGPAVGNSSPLFSFSANFKNKRMSDTEAHTKVSPEEVEISFSSTTSSEATGQWWDSEDFKSEVYAVDSKGSCVPVETAWPANKSTKIPLGFEAKPSSPKRNKVERKQQKLQKQGEANCEFKKTSTSSSSSTQTFSTVGPNVTFSNSYCFSQSHPPEKKATPSGVSTFNITPQHSMFATTPAAENLHTNGTKLSTDVPSSESSNNMQSSNDTPVHILPETIVNGAINVASSAYSRARAVLGNLRLKPNGEALDEQSSGPRSTTENLKLLSEMGFSNATLNVLLLQRYNNDIAKVVVELLNQPQ